MTRISSTGILVFVLLNATELNSAASANRRPPQKSAFWSGPFNACKGTRVTNPVEVVQFHVFATKYFNAIGIKKLMKFLTDHRIPSTAIAPICEMICRLDLIFYARYSTNGNMIVPKDLSPSTYPDFFIWIVTVCRKASPALMLNYKGKKLSLSWEAVEDMVRLTLPPFIQMGGGRIPRDVNFLLHTADYFRSVLKTMGS